MAKVILTDTYLEIEDETMRCRFIPVTDEIIRCITSNGPVRSDDDSLIIEKKEYHQVPFDVEEKETEILLKTAKAGVEYDFKTREITFRHPDGRVWLQNCGRELTRTKVVRYSTGEDAPVIRHVKTVDGERNFIENLRPTQERTAYRAKLFFRWKKDEAIHGLGQAEEGIYNYRGHYQYLYQHNMRIPMPVFVSTEGYGVLIDCCSLMIFNDEYEPSYIFLDTVDQIDYYFMGGGTLDEIVHDYRYLTGKAQLLPKWAYGYIQSKEQYYTAQELLQTVKHYREIQVPLDCVVQDWNTWEKGCWGEKKVDKTRYGDLKECLTAIHDLNAHAMVSVWPNMKAGCENHKEFFDAGYLLNDYSTYNAFDENARRMYWKQAREELFDDGFDAWWCDSTEPFTGPDWDGESKREPWERYYLVGNEHKKYLDPALANAYALVHAKGIYENQRETREDIRVLNLTRSGYASGQRYSAVVWSGDTCATWESLRQQIVEGLNMGMSGYPYWTLDIGGFFTVKDNWQRRGCGCSHDPSPKWFWRGDYEEGVNDKGYCELYTRWLQLGTFLPMFRSHGTDTPREIWNFGQKGTMFYDAIEKFINLRYHLMPYIYSLAASVYFEDSTIMRSLLFDFPEDQKAAETENEFMFGPSLLICVVTEPMYYGPDNQELQREKTWRCYLPKGTLWYDYWTDICYEGGRYVVADAPIDKMPVFVRAGTILATVDGLQYASDTPGEPMKMKIYPGENGSFLFYEDEGDGYAFESGSYATTRFIWDDDKKELTAGPRRGSFPGMRTLEYSVEIVKPVP